MLVTVGEAIINHPCFDNLYQPYPTIKILKLGMVNPITSLTLNQDSYGKSHPVLGHFNPFHGIHSDWNPSS
jgi:hypothetical protein